MNSKIIIFSTTRYKWRSHATRGSWLALRVCNLYIRYTYSRICGERKSPRSLKRNRSKRKSCQSYGATAPFQYTVYTCRGRRDCISLSVIEQFPLLSLSLSLVFHRKKIANEKKTKKRRKTK